MFLETDTCPFDQEFVYLCTKKFVRAVYQEIIVFPEMNRTILQILWDSIRHNFRSLERAPFIRSIRSINLNHHHTLSSKISMETVMPKHTQF